MAAKKTINNEYDAKIVLDKVQTRYLAADNVVRRRKDAWNDRIAFYRGYQWGTKRGYSGSGPVDDEDEVRLVLNQIRPLVRAAVNQLVRSAPQVSVVPATNEISDRAKASASERLLQSVLRRRKIEAAVHEAAHWASICGDAFVKLYWNPHVSRRIETPVYDPMRLPFQEANAADVHTPIGEEGNAELKPPDMGGRLSIAQSLNEQQAPQVDPNTGEPGAPKVTYEGDIDVKFVDSTSLLIDPAARKWDEVRWVIHRREYPKEDLLELYPYDVLGRTTEEYIGGEIGGLERKSDNWALGDRSGSTAEDENNLELCEYWEAPSLLYPNGRLIQYVGDVMLYYGEIPYKPARLPFVHIRGECKVPSTFYSDGIVEDLIAPQKALNYAASKMVEWERTILNPPLLTPNQAEIDDTQYSDVLGKLIAYNAPFKPEWMNVPDIPTSVTNMLTLFGDNMKTISAISDVARGGVPAGAESGRALAFIAEKDTALRYMDQYSYSMAWLDLCKQTLHLAHQYYEEGRLIHILGRNEVWEVIAFSRDDYSIDFDLEIEPFSGVPQSRALRYQEALELYNAGIFGPPADPKVQARLRKTLEWDRSGRNQYEGDDIDRSNARKEQQTTLIGQPAFPEQEDFMADDHGIHLEEHTEFRKTGEFRALDPMLKQQFMQHVMQHEMTLMGQNASVSGQMQQPGMGAGPDGPEQPGPVSTPGMGASGPGGGQPTNAPRPGATEAQALNELNTDVTNVRQRAQSAAGTGPN